MRRFFLVELNVSDDRKTAIKTGYRPDWVGDFKPEYNCAPVLFPTDLPEIGPGNFHRGVRLVKDGLIVEVTAGELKTLDDA